MSDRILILGGTREAAHLAQTLSATHDVITSLAGRTKEPKPLAGDVRIGGFGGVEPMAQWLVDNQIDRVIDATHPFARQISANAIKACQITGIPLIVQQRAPWEKEPTDIWIDVETLDQARDALPEDATVLLALGSQHIAQFDHLDKVHFIIRMVDPPENALNFKSHEIVLGKPSADWRQEADLLKTKNISHIVCRNSGGKGAYAKIKAARELAIPVIIVRMPT